MKKVAIIGFGRFGQLLAELCRPDFTVSIVENNDEQKNRAEHEGYEIISFDAVASSDYIFLAVPISKIEEVIKKLAPLVKANQVVIDICSVKVYPAGLMKKYLSHAQLLATHPLFGPDSAKKGLDGLRVAFCPINLESENRQILWDFWARKGTEVIETTPEQHDKDSVYSQAFTYSLAKIILTMDIPQLTFTTRSYNDIKEIAALSARDSEQLFHDMLFYNPHFKQMKHELIQSLSSVEARLKEIEDEQDHLRLFEDFHNQTEPKTN